MAAISTLSVQLTARTAKFTKGLKRAGSSVRRFAGGVSRIAKRVAALGAAFAAVAVGGIALFVRQAFKSLDVVGKVSDRLKIAVDGLLGLQLAAQITGTSQERLQKGLEVLTRRIGEVQQGFGEGQRALETLGVGVDTLVGKDPAEQFAIIADAVAGLATQTEKAAVANQLFGRAGVELINILDMGGDSIRDFIAENRRLQGTFDRLDVRRIEEANDAITRLRTAFQGFFRRVAVDIAPFVQNVADRLTDALVAFRERGIGRVREFTTRAIELFRTLVDKVVPTAFIIARTYVAEITFLATRFRDGFKFIIGVIGRFIQSIRNATGISASFGEIIRNTLLVAQFGFKNFEQIVDVALDAAILAFVKIGAEARHVFLEVIPTAIKNALRLQFSLFGQFATVGIKAIFSIGEAAARLGKELPKLITGELSAEQLAAELAPAFDRLKIRIPELEKAPERIKSDLEKTLEREVLEGTIGLAFDFERFRRAEIAKGQELAESIQRRLDDLFRFDVPEIDLKLDQESERVINAFNAGKAARALERGTAEALAAERGGANLLERETREIAKESRVTNEKLDDLIRAQEGRRETVVTIPA